MIDLIEAEIGREIGVDGMRGESRDIEIGLESLIGLIDPGMFRPSRR